ncbi:MAG: thiamine phosphate synthase [Desulfuromonadaceae bacterium]|nr:thiamine phosphate synthase [Desulfuromonadaceae bacterium]
MTDLSLYLITDRHQSGGRELTEVVREALEGGVRAVQLREKDLSGAELYRLACELRRLTSAFGARLIINDRPDIALAVEADGVHLGIGSLPAGAVRRLLGPHMIIGYSAHAIDEALRAEVAGADFITFSPVYPTPSKAAYGEPCGVEKLAAAVCALGIPVVALGGITQENITHALSANVHGIAVISAVLAAADPRVAAASLLKKIEEYAKRP